MLNNTSAICPNNKECKHHLMRKKTETRAKALMKSCGAVIKLKQSTLNWKVPPGVDMTGHQRDVVKAR